MTSSRSRAAFAALAALVTAASLSAQAPQKWQPGRTPDGQPDIQGYYNGTDTTSIEPSGFMGYGTSSTGVNTGAYDRFWGADRPSASQVWLTPGTKELPAAAGAAAPAQQGQGRRPSRTDAAGCGFAGRLAALCVALTNCSNI